MRKLKLVLCGLVAGASVILTIAAVITLARVRGYAAVGGEGFLFPMGLLLAYGVYRLPVPMHKGRRQAGKRRKGHCIWMEGRGWTVIRGGKRKEAG